MPNNVLGFVLWLGDVGGEFIVLTVCISTWSEFLIKCIENGATHKVHITFGRMTCIKHVEFFCMMASDWVLILSLKDNSFDFRNAFGSVDHIHNLAIMEVLGYPLTTYASLAISTSTSRPPSLGPLIIPNMYP